MKIKDERTDREPSSTKMKVRITLRFFDELLGSIDPSQNESPNAQLQIACR